MRKSTTNAMRLTKLVTILAVLYGLSLRPLEAQSRILFVNLRLQSDTISLLGSTTRTGLAKQAPTSVHLRAFQYEVRSPGGVLLLEGSIDDPSLQVYEYEDPDRPGQFAAKEVKVEDVQFTLRMPLIEGMHTVEFFRVEHTTGDGSRGARVRRSIGSVQLWQGGGVR